MYTSGNVPLIRITIEIEFWKKIDKHFKLIIVILCYLKKGSLKQF